MKKNLKIGMGLAMVSLVSMSAVFPVFADVKPSYIEKTGTAITINAENTVSETAAGETEKSKEQTADGIDHAKSPNLCKLYLDDKTVTETEPEAKPSDFSDAAIRKLAEEYSKKGYFLFDVKFAATHYGSGMGFENGYVFCNGFCAVDDTKGNNRECIQVVKATPEEFKSFISELGKGMTCVKNGSVTTYEMKDANMAESYSYDETNQVLVVAIKFISTNSVG